MTARRGVSEHFQQKNYCSANLVCYYIILPLFSSLPLISGKLVQKLIWYRMLSLTFLLFFTQHFHFVEGGKGHWKKMMKQKDRWKWKALIYMTYFASAPITEAIIDITLLINIAKGNAVIGGVSKQNMWKIRNISDIRACG